MKHYSVQLEVRSRRVTVGDHSTVLQEKSWQVLSMLQARAPEIVSRADIIDSVWQGQFATGEKGLNQAVWAIRSAVDDDPRNPKFIRTMPRHGYQWIHSEPSNRGAGATKRTRRIVSMTVSAAAVIAMTIYSSMAALGTGVEWAAMTPGSVATDAYLVDRDIHVEFANGRRGILKNENYANISEPVLSSDGAEIVVTVTEDSGCRMVTIKLSNGERQDFPACPSSII